MGLEITAKYDHNSIKLEASYTHSSRVAKKIEFKMGGTTYKTKALNNLSIFETYTWENLTPEQTYYDIRAIITSEDPNEIYTYEYNGYFDSITLLPAPLEIPKPEVIRYYHQSYDSFWIVWSKHLTSQVDTYRISVRNSSNIEIQNITVVNNDVDVDFQRKINGLSPNTDYAFYIYSGKDGQWNTGWGYSNVNTIGEYNSPTIESIESGVQGQEAYYMKVTSNGSSQTAFVEYEEVNFNPIDDLSGYSKSTLEHLFKTSTTIYDENGLNYQGNSVYYYTWEKYSSINVVVYFENTISSSDRSSWESHIQQLFDIVNYYTKIQVNLVFQTWTGSTGNEDWTVAVGSNSMLDDVGNNSDFTNGNYWGRWNTWTTNEHITSAMSRVSIDSNIEPWYTKAVLTEEIIQCLGAGHDTYDRPESIHYEPGTTRKVYPDQIDETLLKIMYTTNNITSGIPNDQLASLLSVSNIEKKSLSSNSSTNVYLNYLKKGTQYRARSWIASSSDGANYTNVSQKTNWIYFTTKYDIPSPIANLKITSKDKNTNTMSISWDASENANKYFINYKMSVNTEWIDPTSGGITDTNYTLTNLLDDTAYDIKVYGKNIDGVNGDPAYIWGVTTNATPLPWKWTTSIDSQGYKLIVDYSMLAQEWNDFCSKINEYRRYKGIGNYSFTTAVSGEDFTANQFNQAIVALDELSNTNIGTRSKGHDILASYFNTMMDILNSIQ